MSRPAVDPILAENLDEFAIFLHQQMGGEGPKLWRTSFTQKWCDDQPNYGFMLSVDGGIVGVIGAIYASRLINDKVERFCNISCWAVLPEYRNHSLRLATALMEQAGYHFTDYTATNIVYDALKFFKFKRMDTRQVVVPNLPSVRTLSGNVRIVDKHDQIEQLLSGHLLKTYLDHSHLPWLHQVVIRDSNQLVHVAFKIFKSGGCSKAVVLSVSDPDVFTQNFWIFRHYLLFVKGLTVTRVAEKYLTKLPLIGVSHKRTPRKTFRSETLSEKQFDDLYSELVCIDLPEKFF